MLWKVSNVRQTTSYEYRVLQNTIGFLQIMLITDVPTYRAPEQCRVVLAFEHPAPTLYASQPRILHSSFTNPKSSHKIPSYKSSNR